MKNTRISNLILFQNNNKKEIYIRKKRKNMEKKLLQNVNSEL